MSFLAWAGVTGAGRSTSFGPTLSTGAGAGSAGAYALAAISGILDVDAISLSMARLAPERLDATTAIIAILIAVAVNSIAKVAIASSIGGSAYARLLVPVLGATVAAGAAGLWLAMHL